MTKPNLKPKRDCICLRCDGEQFIVIPNARIEQHYKHMLLHVITPGIVCANCGWLTVNVEQVDELVKRTKKLYKSKSVNHPPMCETKTARIAAGGKW